MIGAIRVRIRPKLVAAARGLDKKRMRKGFIVHTLDTATGPCITLNVRMFQLRKTAKVRSSGTYFACIPNIRTAVRIGVSLKTSE